MTGGKKLPVVGQPSPLERLRAGDSAGVIDDLRAAVAVDEDNDAAWLQLASAYAHIAHWAEACDAYAKAIALDGASVAARRAFAQALSRQRRYDEAAFQLVQAKRLAPDDARVAHELGVVFYDKRLFAKALTELNRARSLAPDDARICFAIGLAHEAAGDMADAIAAYRDAVARDPHNIDARRTLADALTAMGEMAAAVEELAEAQARDRPNREIALNLDILKKGLRDLEATRLLGKPPDAIAQSALVSLGGLARAGEGLVYRSELVTLVATLAETGNIDALALVFPEPDKAAGVTDHSLEVTVVSTSGEHERANLATAATLAFLRDALGCPLTRAGQLYALLLETREPVRWGTAVIELAEIVHGDASPPRSPRQRIGR